MAISGDQQATLQLLLERGKSYSDLGQLLGQPEAEVRARARAALTELGGADPDRHVGLTDYLLGQADPIGRADASRHLRDDPADHQLASELSDRLRELFPNAELPRLPGQPRSGGGLLRRTPAPASAPDAPRPQAALSRSQTRLLVVLGSAAVLLIAVVLAVTGAFGGDDDGGEATADSPTTTTASQSDERAVPITMRPEKGSDAGGAVVFGFATADQPFIEFQIRNLEPAANGDAYVLWFLLGQGQGFPLPTALNVSANGSLSDRIPVPPEVIAFAQQAKSIVIALNDGQKLNREITEAVNRGNGALDFPGGTVLSADLSDQARAAASPDS